jgi:hypothetical protein
MYFATGATHAPHHAPKEYIEKYKGKFDQGWDKLREETFAKQKALGVIRKMLSSLLVQKKFLRGMTRHLIRKDFLQSKWKPLQVLPSTRIMSRKTG